MKILVCGSRSITDKEAIFVELNNRVRVDDIIIQGGCQGVDTFAQQWCFDHQIATITVRPCRTDIKEYYLHRNAEMIGMCDEVICFWDGVSRGSKFVIEYAKMRQKPIKLIKIEEKFLLQFLHNTFKNE